jgi:spermidine synthase
MASQAKLDTSSLNLTVPTRFLDAPTLRALFVFPLDMQRQQVEPNSLIQPVLPGYYREGWRQVAR